MGGFSIQAPDCLLIAVADLLNPSGPPNVSGFVSALAVNPIELVARVWWRSHVGEERSEIMPPLTDSDAASAIETV
jgi:hypothetical protein